jgi:hypothetical protein
MTRLTTASLVLALGGCATLPGAAGQPSNLEVLKALGEHISQCERHYQGGLGVGASFTFNIDCQGQPVPARPPAT